MSLPRTWTVADFMAWCGSFNCPTAAKRFLVALERRTGVAFIRRGTRCWTIDVRALRRACPDLFVSLASLSMEARLDELGEQLDAHAVKVRRMASQTEWNTREIVRLRGRR